MKRLMPTEITLTDLPEEGRDFSFDRSSGELDSTLADLLGDNPYRVQCFIKPEGNVFFLTGSYEAEIETLCSRCGIEIKPKIAGQLSEILVIEESPLGRKDSLAKVNHTSDLESRGPEATLLDSAHFSIGDFFHEQMALAIPVQPVGTPDCYTSCENLEDAYRKGWLARPGAAPVEDKDFDKHKPFKGLENFKLKLN